MTEFIVNFQDPTTFSPIMVACGSIKKLINKNGVVYAVYQNGYSDVIGQQGDFPVSGTLNLGQSATFMVTNHTLVIRNNQ